MNRDPPRWGSGNATTRRVTTCGRPRQTTTENPTMERRKFVIGMGALASGTAAAVGTGAFSSVEAHRDFAVEVADDSDAYLGLTAESHYARENGGAIELDFSSDNETEDEDGEGLGGEGLNQNGTTMFTHVFSIHNQGTNTVGIQIDRPDLPSVEDDEKDDHVHFFVGEQGGDSLSDYSRDEMEGELDYDNPEDDDRVLTPGDDLKVGLYFLNHGKEWDFDEEFTINALDQETASHVAEESD